MSGTEGSGAIANDDAVADCIVYASECRKHKVAEDQRVRLTRRVAEAAAAVSTAAAAAASSTRGRSDKECSIPMCGNEDDPSSQLLQYCENGHYLHDACIEYIFDKAESLSTAVCPQCRSERMIHVVTRAKPIESEKFALWTGPRGTAERIVAVAARETPAAVAEMNSSSTARAQAVQ